MPPKRRNFQRSTGSRSYRKLFVIAVEGKITEPQYFDMLQQVFNANGELAVIQIRCLEGNHDSSPPRVLKRMENYLKQERLKSSDEAWLVIDKDHWTDEQLDRLCVWKQKKSNYHFALSNPKFEYWLLLHFEDCNGIASSRDCNDRLKRHLPNYDKRIGASQITREQINDAIRRARQRDHPPCTDWPREFGKTTVYKLVSNILRLR